jgi:hypothetical protein
MPPPGPWEAIAAFTHDITAIPDTAPPIRAFRFALAQDMTISCEDAFRRYANKPTPAFEICRSKFCLLREGTVR